MTDSFQLEQTHLEGVIGKIDKETMLAVNEVERTGEAFRYALKNDPDFAPARELLYENAVETLNRLRLSATRPYFTRLDFTEKGQQPFTFYIGKYGLRDSATMEPFIYDWRAPISNLYYSGQLGHVSYTAPDGQIEGELTLKRQLDVREGRLLSVFDTDVMSQDAYLQKALTAMTGDRLKDIVTTIQSEQNLIIRHPLARNLIVQGAAGSGKTTVALHRIAYLLYAYADRLRPERMLILAPSPLFLNYISGVLPDLGVEHVRQTTYDGFLQSWLGTSYKIADGAKRLDSLLKCTKGERDTLNRISVIKVSLTFRTLLNNFLEEYEKSFVPADGLVFGPARLYTREELDRFLLKDEAPFCYERRLAEFKKQLQKRVSGAVTAVTEWLRKECDRRVAIFEARMEEGPELRGKLRNLFASRDARIEETRSGAEPFVEKVMTGMPSCDPISIYSSFLEKLLASGGDLKLAAEHTLSYLGTRKTLEQEDLAPLALITFKAKELTRQAYRHIVVDEAQDLSPFMVSVLRTCMPDATFTLVGDLMQGITAGRGTSAWEQLSEGVFAGRADVAFLTTSYRSTREIMGEAFKIAGSRQSSGDIRVIRSGQPVSYRPAANQSALIHEITLAVQAARKEGMTSIAIIEKTAARASKLCGRLPSELGAKLLDCGNDTYEQGLYVACAGDVKGLEFDAVIIADASADVYSAGDLDAGLLYVAMTRALHSLTVLYTGNLVQPLIELTP